MKNFTTKDLVLIAFCSALTAVCAWITVPAPVPFTLQTFAIALSLRLLGGKKGTLSILLYILIGAIGLPVFSGFKGGLGTLFGLTGGYIVGFIAMGLVYLGLEKSFRCKFLALLLGLLSVYVFGTAWFMVMFTKTKGEITLIKTLSLTIFPFVIPDLIKLFLASLVAKRVDLALQKN